MRNEMVTAEALAEVLYRLLDSGFAAAEVEHAHKLLQHYESQREKRNALSDELRRTKDELARVIKAYDSAMVRLREEVIRRTALNREDRIPGPSKRALSEVEQAALEACGWWTDDDWRGASVSMKKLRDALKRIGAL